MYPRLAELREDHDLSQAQMANILGVSQATYSRYETGRLDIPSQTLIALAQYYGVSVDYLLGLDERKQK
ncbi:helix-turn-helix domain-containing protein [Flavonifractor sp. HCP28S3_F3]|uniref:helix-turn-helix domain-containing protein n=1 Tax=Flavonifractor sp. HCP28S3_F3 TaxID=3438939 RepID=UPI003F89DE0D